MLLISEEEIRQLFLDDFELTVEFQDVVFGLVEPTLSQP